MQSITREIYFFRVHAEDKDGKPVSFNPKPALRYIKRLKCKRRGGRYWDQGESVTCCWPDRFSPRAALRLGTIRRRDLPQKEVGGVLKSLGIPPRAGLAELTHIVFFEDGIVGCDFNYFGPRVTKLADYLREKVPASLVPAHLSFEPLLRNDAADHLQQAGHIKLFRLKVRSSMVRDVERASQSLGEALRVAMGAGEAEEAEIILRPKPRSAEGLSSKVVKIARRLIRKRALREGGAKVSAEAVNDQNERIKLDLLSDKLIAKRRILRQDNRTRALNRIAAYEAIKSAHKALRREFPRASTAALR